MTKKRVKLFDLSDFGMLAGDRDSMSGAPGVSDRPDPKRMLVEVSCPIDPR